MNKIISWYKQHKAFSVTLAILFALFVWVYKPYKIKDPSSPLYVESWFRLSDYDFRPGKLIVDLEKLFPIGTPMEKVDRILIEYGGARKINQTEYAEGQYCYTYQPFYMKITPDNWCIRVYYTKNNRLRMIYFGQTLINTAPNHYTGE